MTHLQGPTLCASFRSTPPGQADEETLEGMPEHHGGCPDHGWWGPVRPLARVSISLSAVYIGVAMLAYPDRAGAMEGPMWGVAMVLWGTVLALLPANGTTAMPPRQSARQPTLPPTPGRAQ